MITNKQLREIISKVNESLLWFKPGGWIDAKRTPQGSVNLVETLQEYVEARFNRECFDIPELTEIFDVFDGKVWVCELTDPNEDRRKYGRATLTLVDPNKVYIDDNGHNVPQEKIIELLGKVRDFFGGSVVTFNSVKVKIEFKVLEQDELETSV